MCILYFLALSIEMDGFYRAQIISKCNQATVLPKQLISNHNQTKSESQDVFI